MNTKIIQNLLNEEILAEKNRLNNILCQRVTARLNEVFVGKRPYQLLFNALLRQEWFDYSALN